MESDMTTNTDLHGAMPELSLSEILAMCLSSAPVGSRVTCNPPVLDTDADYLALVLPIQYREFENTLYRNKFTLDGSLVLATGCETGDPETFQSFKRGSDNIIVTANSDFYQGFLAASSIAKRLNLLHKADRIALFQAVLYSTIDEALS